ncbi:MurR/RpiR family transcriptional regulator [Bacillus sp. MUM 13]|uniref:MurR/RpiR family transcriptional regulator n=1 Tax=Bacillus sp. MUM 13 TaxID=1678001 RepID=UPI0008F5675A|nr:MurR/RpiR family transcriptional regulator [Bacillus sp. MUM 13]OIK12871.1 RpiR family transcriptional regulator [Bacillus sp. MUM 13]
MNTNCLSKIRSYYPRFSDKEKIIADYILENSGKIIHCSINEVAEDLKVAEATVFRFCKRIGYKGYQAMKIALASESMTAVQPASELINDGENITEKIFKSNIRSLANTLQINECASVEKAAECILFAKRVSFYGAAGSSAIAMDAFQKFISAGFHAYSFMDSHSQSMFASHLDSQDTAVVISHSGSDKESLKILDAALEKGAKTIAITGFPNSPLARRAHVSLCTSSEETEYRPEDLASLIIQLSLIDALYVNVMVKRREIPRLPASREKATSRA